MRNTWANVTIAGISYLFATSASAQPAVLPQLGGSGGAHFEAFCIEGTLLAGFQLRVGDDVDAIRAVCVAVSPSGEPGRQVPHRSRFGGTGGGADRELLCSRDAPVVIGIRVGYEGATTVINSIHLFCGKAAGTWRLTEFPSATFDGPQFTSDQRGPLSGAFSIGDSDLQQCPTGLVGVGMTGRSGKWLDALGLVCGEPTATAAERRSGAQARSDVTQPLPSPSQPFVGSNDYNADGLGDILWHNSSTGESQVWLMNGSSRIGRTTITDGGRPALIGHPWRIASSRDFNADGKSDLLWHNGSTGETQIWHMNGRAFSGRVTVLGENGAAALVGMPWTIVGSNDMNVDGKPDIIWYNTSSGETQLWLMSGAGYKVGGRATVVDENGRAILIGPPWSIVGSGDFNRDTQTDLLWHNASTGHTQIWHMNGNRIIGRATVLDEKGSQVAVGLPWRIAGSNDFDRNGTADILWHNGSTGHTQMWLMKGHSIVSRVIVDADRDGGGAVVGKPWTIMNH